MLNTLTFKRVKILILHCQISVKNGKESFCSRKLKEIYEILLKLFLNIFRYLHRHTVKGLGTVTLRNVGTG
jgi:hypothetical protein